MLHSDEHLQPFHAIKQCTSTPYNCLKNNNFFLNGKVEKKRHLKKNNKKKTIGKVQKKKTKINNNNKIQFSKKR